MPKLFIANQRMLQLWSYAVTNDMVADDATWCKKIGFVKGNTFNVKKGTQGFTLKQIHAAAKVTGANLNWLFGFESEMFRSDKERSGLDLLRQAVVAVENEYR